MSTNTEAVEAWETEHAALVVWGTHSPERAYAAAAKWYTENVGPNDIPEGLAVELVHCIITGAGRYWGSPKLREIEDERPWPSPLISAEPVDDWTPYLVVSW